MTKSEALNEFRQDLVSGEWVLFATGRAAKPNPKHIDTDNEEFRSKKNCPFEDIIGSGNEILWLYPDDKNWDIAVIKNKYPALMPGICVPSHTNGPFSINKAVGSHDVVVYKDHDTHFGDMTIEQLDSVTKIYKKRYNEILETGGDCTQHIMIFHNFGVGVGASLYHPHSQIISMPILPPDISRSLYGSQKFYKEKGQKIYDLLVNWEIEQKNRIIYENEFFIAFCPFVSKYPYELRIFPKDGHAHFEKMPDPLDKYLADAMSVVFKKIKKALNDPPYNFFIHTASVKEDPDNKFHEFYTWHIEIIPKLGMIGGFELGTGVYVNVVDPDEAAKLLRETNV